MAVILSQKTTIKFNGSLVGGVTSITGIGSGSATEIDTTTLASDAKEFSQGLRDFGSIELDLIRDYADVGQAAMATAMAAQATEEIIVTLPAATNNTLTFSGFVQSLPSDIAADSKVMGKAKIRITGAVVVTTVAP